VKLSTLKVFLSIFMNFLIGNLKAKYPLQGKVNGENPLSGSTSDASFRYFRPKSYSVCCLPLL
jgi:hypothetical protein